MTVLLFPTATGAVETAVHFGVAKLSVTSRLKPAADCGQEIATQEIATLLPKRTALSATKPPSPSSDARVKSSEAIGAAAFAPGERLRQQRPSRPIIQ